MGSESAGKKRAGEKARKEAESKRDEVDKSLAMALVDDLHDAEQEPLIAEQVQSQQPEEKQEANKE